MSLFGGLVAGAMVGGGGALQQVARDQEQSEQALKRMQLQAKLEEDRQTRLEEMRAKNTEKSNEQQHGFRIEEIGARDKGENERLDKSLTARGAEHDKDVEQRARGYDIQEKDLASRAADRRTDNARLAASQDIAKQELKLRQDHDAWTRAVQEGKTGFLGKLPEGEREAYKTYTHQAEKLNEQLGRAMASPTYDENSTGVKELRTRQEGYENKALDILRKHGAVPELPAAEKKDSPSIWSGLDKDTQSAMVSRAEAMRGKPEFDKYLDVLGSKYGASKDVLDGLRKEPEQGLVRKGLSAIDNAMRSTNQPAPGLINGGRSDADLANAAARAAQVRAITPQNAGNLSPAQVQELAKIFPGFAEFSKPVRDILLQRMQ